MLLQQSCMRCGEDNMTLGTKIAHILCFSEEDCDTMLPPDSDMRVERQKEEKKDFGEMESESHAPVPGVTQVYADYGTHKVEIGGYHSPMGKTINIPVQKHDTPSNTDSQSHPQFVYGARPSCVVQLHLDGVKVPDITVISPYEIDSDGWKHDKDFLSGFMEISKGVPIGKYKANPVD